MRRLWAVSAADAQAILALLPPTVAVRHVDAAEPGAAETLDLHRLEADLGGGAGVVVVVWRLVDAPPRTLAAVLALQEAGRPRALLVAGARPGETPSAPPTSTR